MRGRMIHTLSGKLDSQPYDRDGQVPTSSFICSQIILNAPVPKCINSIDRALLNIGLLDEVSASNKIRILFNHKVVAADFDRKIITVKDTASGLDSEVGFDFCIGADGSYSVTRRQLMRVARQVVPSLCCDNNLN